MKKAATPKLKIPVYPHWIFNPMQMTAKIAMVASVGATQTLMKQHGDWWVTVVGDVPPATLRMFADGLERRK